MKQPDSMEVPLSMVNAAIALDAYFSQQGIDDWALMGVCSRNMYEKLKASANSVTTENTLQHMAAKL